METKITAHELGEQLTEVLDRVLARGERFPVERNGEPLARLGPASGTLGITAAELIARLGELPLPGEGFADDLEAIQAEQPKAEWPEWPSRSTRLSLSGWSGVNGP